MPPPPPEPADQQTAQAPVLDEPSLDRLRQLDPGGQNRLLQRVLGTYAASLSKLMRQLQIARKVSDMAAVHMAVHTLKSSSSSVGALSLANLCADAERAVRDRRFDALPTMLIRLEAEAQRVDAAVQQLLAQTK